MVAAGIFLLVGLGNVSSALAETAKTTKSTRVMQRPTERALVITRVGAGKVVQVLNRDGSWVKIRVNGRTGWVSRTSIAGTVNARKPVNKTRRRPFVEGRSKRRNWSGGAADDRIGADAVGDDEEVLEEDEDDEDTEVAARSKRSKKARTNKRARDIDDEDDEDIEDEEDEDDEDLEAEVEQRKSSGIRVVSATKLRSKPSTRSKAIVRVAKGAELTLVEKNSSGEWMLVEDADGERGWIRGADVRTSTISAGYAYPKLGKVLMARAGFTKLDTLFAADGGGELANYNISSAALALDVGGEILFRYKPKYMIGADLSYTGTRASPGIRYTNAANGQAVDIGFLVHEVRAGVSGGYNLQNSMGIVVFGRIGYYYSFFGINDAEDPAKNPIKLPSEILRGVTLGSHVAIPKINDKFGARVAADVLAPGSRQQTVGLSDGEVGSLISLWASAVGTYTWKPDIKIEAGYRYYYSKTTWMGTSDRVPGATVSARRDVNHLVSIGIDKSF